MTDSFVVLQNTPQCLPKPEQHIAIAIVPTRIAGWHTKSVNSCDMLLLLRKTGKQPPVASGST